MRAAAPLFRSQFHYARSRGLSLLEVLVSMFILLFGLVGVASLFPVGKYHAQQALQYDQAAAVGQRAFQEIRVRGLLRPTRWNLADGSAFISTATASTWQSTPVMFDPIGVSEASAWVPHGITANGLRRVTWRDESSGNNLSPGVARYMFTNHDDLALELPAARSTPAIQLIGADERIYNGAYTWAFTAIPAPNMGEGFYTVSVVVFRGRSVPTEEWFCGDAVPLDPRRVPGETAFQLTAPGATALEKKDNIARIRAGEWILISEPTPSVGYYGWFKIVSLGQVNAAGDSVRVQAAGALPQSVTPTALRASVFSSVVAVYQQSMRAESDTDWLVD